MSDPNARKRADRAAVCGSSPDAVRIVGDRAARYANATLRLVGAWHAAREALSCTTLHHPSGLANCAG
jgi:hypothetical protein